MTVAAMSTVFPSQQPGPGLAIRPPASILSATLSQPPPRPPHSPALHSRAAAKLGFSIDSIVGGGGGQDTAPASPKREPGSPPARSPSPAHRARSRSPVYRPRSPGSPPSDSPPVSPGPAGVQLARPIPTSGAASSYLDQLAQLKAFYDSRGAAAAAAAGLGAATPPSQLPPGLGLPGLHPAVLSALPRPPGPVSLPGGLPPFLSSLPGQQLQHPGLGQQLPREYPLYPWFLNRNRFPGGEHTLFHLSRSVTTSPFTPHPSLRATL